MGSLTVVSIKAIGVAIKLTLDGVNQAAYPYTWLFLNCLWGFSNKLPEQGMDILFSPYLLHPWMCFADCTYILHWIPFFSYLPE
ncbi:hypothetical protein Zm00014a_040850 [Zea mays]|uniref:Magnesium transporter n=2 Tax=Zea mays TaxID=4577 RepID=A0A317YBX0_MAIZE|nr:putative magnesium transporter NIPA6 [Zea mays]PWZ55244.1 hypothetical protein Zm00014a_040850 [Zea mays]